MKSFDVPKNNSENFESVGNAGWASDDLAKTSLGSLFPPKKSGICLFSDYR